MFGTMLRRNEGGVDLAKKSHVFRLLSTSGIHCYDDILGRGLRHKAICFDYIYVMFCPTSFTMKSRTQPPPRNWEIEIERESQRYHTE